MKTKLTCFAYSAVAENENLEGLWPAQRGELGQRRLRGCREHCRDNGLELTQLNWLNWRCCGAIRSFRENVLEIKRQTIDWFIVPDFRCVCYSTLTYPRRRSIVRPRVSPFASFLRNFCWIGGIFLIPQFSSIHGLVVVPPPPIINRIPRLLAPIGRPDEAPEEKNENRRAFVPIHSPRVTGIVINWRESPPSQTIGTVFGADSFVFI